MAIRKFTVPVTTAADGTATVYSPYLSGFLESIQYVKTNFADGVDFTITADGSGETLWGELNVNAQVIKRPRVVVHSTAGVAGTNAEFRIALGRERVKIAVAQGGNATTGAFVVTVDDGR